MPDVVVEVPKQIDLLDTGAPSLSATSDMPVVETKPDASPPEKKETAPPAEVKEPEVAEKKPEESATPETPDDAAAEPEPKKAKGVQKRIDELTRQREDERRRAEAAEARELRILAALEKATGSKDKQEPQKPVLDPNNPDAYNAALEEYVVAKAGHAAEEKVKEKLAEEEKKRQDSELAAQTRKVQEDYKARVEKAREKHPDYSEVAESPDVQVSMVMASAIAHSEDGPEIAYFLGKNPAEAERISKLVPQLQLVELGRISQRLVTPPTPSKPVSAAPAPGKPIKASSEASKSADEESMEEYASRRKKQLAEERRPGVRH